MRTILKSLIAVYESAKVQNDSEVINAVNDAINSGAPVQLINRCLSFAHSSNQIENIRLTVIAELRSFKFCMN